MVTVSTVIVCQADHVPKELQTLGKENGEILFMAYVGSYWLHLARRVRKRFGQEKFNWFGNNNEK